MGKFVSKITHSLIPSPLPLLTLPPQKHVYVIHGCSLTKSRLQCTYVTTGNCQYISLTQSFLGNGHAYILHHSMARANLNKSVWLLTNTTTASKYIPRRTRISINLSPPFQSSLHKIFKNWFMKYINLVSQCSYLEVLLLSKFDSERGDFNWSDSGPLGYVRWCCGGICHQPDTFILIGSGHTVAFYVLSYSKV